MLFVVCLLIAGCGVLISAAWLLSIVCDVLFLGWYRCLLLDDGCLMFVVCCSLATCCSLFFVGWLFSVGCCLVCAVRCWLPIVYCCLLCDVA